jgi:Domain of unknown function (DUF4034)
MRAIKTASATVLMSVVASPPLWAQSFTRISSAVSSTPFFVRQISQEQQGQDENSDTDTQPARAFRTTVRNLFNEEKFQQLEEIAGTVRFPKERLRGGAWKLSAFYQIVQGPGSLTSTDAVWNEHVERLQRWIAAKPNSITPRVALAQCYLRMAWKARGNGYGNTVTADDWKLFKQRVQQAQDTLEQAESASTKDAQWYRNMQIVARAQGWERSRAEDLLQKASSAEPGYFYFYNEYANFLLPKWYGKPGESEAFARTIADRIGGPEGDFVYFRIAAGLNCCKPKAQMPDISWDRVKQGFAAVEQLYGSTNHQLNALAFMAVRQGDREFAQQLFARIADDWDEDVWHSKERFTRAKTSLSLDNSSSVTAKQ